MKTHKQFLLDWSGKKIDYDKQFGFQCIDLIKLYYKEVYNIELGVFGGSALIGWQKGLPFGSNWERIENKPGNLPPVGAVVFFDKTPTNLYGHVAIAGICTKLVLQVIEQNGGVGKGTGLGVDAIRLHNYDYVKPAKCLGWYKLKD